MVRASAASQVMYSLGRYNVNHKEENIMSQTGITEQVDTTNDLPPRPFKEIPGLWLQIGRMTEEFFQQEVSRTSTQNTLLSVLIFAVISAIASALSSLLGSGSNMFGTALPSPSNTGGMSIFLLCCGFFMIPIGFYLSNSILLISALIFSGKGSFNAQAYLASLYYVPLGIIGIPFTLMSAIPNIGIYINGITAMVIALLHVFFTVRSVKVVHEFSTGHATAAVLAPLSLILIPLCMVVVLVLFGQAMEGVFSSMATPMP